MWDSIPKMVKKMKCDKISGTGVLAIETKKYDVTIQHWCTKKA